jgi:hypothetical protein
MVENRRVIVLGILNVVGAAIASLAVLAVVEAQSLVDVVLGAVLLPLYGVFVFSWYVVPLGVLLGAVMPKVVAGRSRRSAFFIGAAMGAVVAIMSALVYQGVTVC